MPRRYEVQEYLTNVPDSNLGQFDLIAETQKEKNFQVKCVSFKRSKLPVFKQFNVNYNIKTSDRSLCDDDARSKSYEVNNMKQSGTDNNCHMHSSQYSSYRQNNNMKNSFMSNSLIDTPLISTKYFKKEPHREKNQFKHVPRSVSKNCESASVLKNKCNIESTTHYTVNNSNKIGSHITGQNTPVINNYQQRISHKSNATQDRVNYSFDGNIQPANIYSTTNIQTNNLSQHNISNQNLRKSYTNNQNP